MAREDLVTPGPCTGYSFLLSVGAVLCDVVTPVQERATVFQSVRRFVFSGDLVFSISFAGVSVRVLVISLVLGMVFRGNLDQWQPRGVGNDIGAGWSQARLRGDSACLSLVTAFLPV